MWLRQIIFGAKCRARGRPRDLRWGVEGFVAATRKHSRQTYRCYIHIENETNTDTGVNKKWKSCSGAVRVPEEHAAGAGITHIICRSRNRKEEVNRYWTLRGEGGLTDTYHGVKEFQNSLGVADTRRHRDTERQDRLLHRYLHPSVQPHPVFATGPADCSSILVTLRCNICRLIRILILAQRRSPFALEQHHHYQVKMIGIWKAVVAGCTKITRSKITCWIVNSVNSYLYS